MKYAIILQKTCNDYIFKTKLYPSSLSAPSLKKLRNTIYTLEKSVEFVPAADQPSPALTWLYVAV